MRMRKIFLFFLVVLFTSCHGDFHELSEKYVSNSRWTEDGKYIPYEVVIGRKVTNYNHDNDFIIVHQVNQHNREKVHHYWIIRLADDMGAIAKGFF